MAAIDGISYEWLENLEDEIAIMINARNEHLDVFRTDYKLLLQRGAISQPLYNERMDRIDEVAHALRLGKSNTARLRNSKERVT